MAYSDKDRQKEYQKRWKAKRRAEWLKENGPCHLCGSWDQLEVLIHPRKYLIMFGPGLRSGVKQNY